MGIGLGFGFGPLRFYIPLVRGGRRRPRSRYWTHPGCTIHHRTQEAAGRCKVGRVAAPPPAAPRAAVAPPAPAPLDPESFPALRPVLAKAMVELDDLYPLFAQAAARVFTTGYVSAPMLRQWMLAPAYGVPMPDSVANGFLELMEVWGLVGPTDGAGVRKLTLHSARDQRT